MYKVFIKQIKDDKIIGTACLVKDYDKLSSAIKSAKKNLLTNESKFRIREYDDASQVNIISDDDNDTGTIIMDY